MCDHSTVLQKEPSYQDRYGSAIERLQEHDAFAATVGFYAASGHGRGQAPTAEDASVRDQLLEAIPSIVTAEMKGDALRAFRSGLSTDRILICACCGKRDCDTFTAHSLNASDPTFRGLGALRLSDAQLSIYQQRPENLRSLFNAYQAPDGYCYHLVREGLVTGDRGQLVAMLCSGCEDHVKNRRVPRYCIASGYDYGRISDLPELSLLEKIVVSPYRAYMTILKLKAAVGGSPGSAQTCLHGHAIMFEHDAPTAVVEVLPRHSFTDVSRDVAITFLGPRDEWQQRRAELLQPTGPHRRLFKCNVQHIMVWLHVMRSLHHPAYAALDDNVWDFSHEALQQLTSLPEQLVENAHCTDRKEVHAIERDTTDDTARARPQGDVDSADGPPAVDGIHGVLITSRDVQQPHVSAITTAASGLASALNLTSETSDHLDTNRPLQNMETQTTGVSEVNRGHCGDTSRPQPICLTARVRTNRQHPVNEYTGRVFLHAFPYHYILGTGDGGQTSDTQPGRLLLWHDGRFATDDRFQFFSFDMMRRWASSRGVSCKVKSDQASIEAFDNLVGEADFDQRLQHAISHPNDADATRLMRHVMPLLTVCGSRVPYSATQRSLTITRMSALIHFAGLPLWFWTIAPSDIDSIPALRIAGLQFPLPSLQSRAHCIASNPAAAARAFQLLVNSVFSCLFGLDPPTTRKKSPAPFASSTRRSRRCLLCGGHCVAYFAVTETQGRGALHLHGCLFCTVGPTLLQRCQADQDLVARIASLIDSIIIATLPEECHQQLTNRRELHLAPERVGLTAGWSTPMPDEGNGQEYLDWVRTVVATTNVHRHSSTCRKGPIGEKRCRLAFPRGVNAQGTRPMLIEKVPILNDRNEPTDRYDVVESQRDIPVMPRAVDFTRYPLPLARPFDNTTVVWEVGRHSQDQLVVETVEVLAAAVGGNTNVQLLGSSAQAKSAVYYTFKYMQKDAHELTSSLSILREALHECQVHPSVAEDRDTNPLRFAQHVLARCLNKANAAMEVSSQQAAAALLKHDGFQTSHDFWFCFIRPAMADVRARWQQLFAGTSANESQDRESNGTSANGSDSDENGDDEVSIVDRERADTSADPQGPAEIFVVGQRRRAVPQHVHYRYRGPSLAHLSLYEYCALVVIKPLPPSDHSSRQSSTSSHGRQPNAAFRFHDDHPLATSHRQHLRSKFLVPVLAGKPPPKRLGPQQDTAHWRRCAEEFGVYYVSLLVPWSVELPFLPPVPPTFAGLSQWASHASAAQPVSYGWLDRCRYDVLSTVATGLSVNTHEKALCGAWRGRCAQRWENSQVGSRDRSGLELGQSNQGHSALLQEPLVEGNSTAAIQLLRQYFASPQEDHAHEVQYVLDTISRLHENTPTDDFQPCEDRPAHSPRGPSAFCSSRMEDVQAVASNLASYNPVNPQEARTDGRLDSDGTFCADMNGGIEQEAMVDRSVMESLGLNSRQNEAFLEVVDWYERRQAHRADAYHHAAPPPLLLLVHGGPGTGKSYFARSLARAFPQERLSYAATTGVAATAFPEGRTVHNLLSLPLVAKDYKPLSVKNRATVERNLRLTSPQSAVWILVIDEVSMMGASQLAQVADRLCELGDPQLPFGGFGVILMGDFYQLASVGTKPLYVASLQLSSSDGHRAQMGAHLFRQFRLFELTEQMRAAECSIQRSLIDSFRTNEHPFRREHLRYLKQLTATDIRGDASWLDAIIVTPGNHVRCAINKDRIVRLAQHLRVPVLRWKLPLIDESARQLPQAVIDDMYDRYSDAWAYFVVSAPAYVDFNMKPSLGVANGTSCVLHSIVMDPSTSDLEEIERTYAVTAPGEFVNIPVPRATNVQLVGLAAETWPADAPSVNNLRPPVLPLPGKGKNTILLGPKVLDQHARHRRKKRAMSAATSGFDLGFAATFHKIQGKTVPKIILCLNKVPRDLGQLSTQSLYVGLTRVKRNEDMRIFPLRPGQNLDHLLRLKVDPKIAEWRRQYDQRGKWQPLTQPAPPCSEQRPSATTSSSSSRGVAILPGRCSAADNDPSLTRGENPMARIEPARSSRLCTPRRHPLLLQPDDNRNGGARHLNNSPRTMQPLAWGSPADETYSWLFVPLIRAALQLDPARQYYVETLAEPQRWAYWVRAYAEDFQLRGITANALPFQLNGYLSAEHQERLLYTNHPLYDIHGESSVDVDVQTSLLHFGVEVHSGVYA